jgi:hypothetical protein
MRAPKIIQDGIKFDQGWIGTLGYLYMWNEGKGFTQFKVFLNNLDNITFEDNKEPVKNLTRSIGLLQGKDCLLLFRHTDCLKSVSIGEISTEIVI